jgi:hypothetical protein
MVKKNHDNRFKIITIFIFVKKNHIMYHPYYEDAHLFTPKSESVQAWLKTRKKNSSNKPGIFETTEFKKDQIWSFASILIEISALYFTFQGAYKSYLQTGNIWIVWVALIAVALFVGFDIIGIMLHGHDKAEKTIDRSMYIVHPDSNVRLQIYNRMNETTIREFFGILLLCISAFLKIGALWYFFQMSNIPILIVFTFLYIIVIYIHAQHTVYWWPALKLKISIKKQYRNWKKLHLLNLPTPSANTIDSTQIINYPFTSNNKISSQTIISSCENNRISVSSDGNGNYTLTSVGPLWDENIVYLCSQWGQNNQDDLIHACIRVQLMQCGFVVPAVNNSSSNNSSN